MMVGIAGSLLFIVRADDKIAAGGSLEEVGHVIAAGGHDLLVVIYIFRAYRGHRGFIHQFGHGDIVYARKAAIEGLYIAAATHGASNAIGNLADAAQQPGAIFLVESSHGTLQLNGFRDDVKGGACPDGADGDDSRTE